MSGGKENTNDALRRMLIGVAPYISKLYSIANEPGNQHLITWVRGGTCLLVRNERQFTEQILMHDFKCLVF